jgi:RNA polymerase sigma-70 factor (ECF subfamily)
MESATADSVSGWPAHDSGLAGRARRKRVAPVGVVDELVARQFRGTVRRQSGALQARALVLTRDPESARDLVQDTLLKALSSLHTFEPASNMAAWLMKILVNLFIDRYRRRSAQPSMVPLCENVLEIASSPERDPLPMSARVTSEQLHAAFDQLGPAFREAYQLRIVEKLSYEQIAARLGIPVGTVGTRLARARQQLRRLLTPRAMA